MKLITKEFYNNEDLERFINNNAITKENIQSICVAPHMYKPFVLFYWE